MKKVNVNVFLTCILYRFLFKDKQLLSQMYRFKKNKDGLPLTTSNIQEALKIAAVSLESLVEACRLAKAYSSA